MSYRSKKKEHNQSAFQPSKAISDNILVAFETLHHMKNQKLKKVGFMAKIMEKMGFVRSGYPLFLNA